MQSQSISGQAPSVPGQCFFRSDSSEINPKDGSTAIPRTLDELWDLLNEGQKTDDVYSIDDAIFPSEQEESKFWAGFGLECARDREHPPP